MEEEGAMMMDIKQLEAEAEKIIWDRLNLKDGCYVILCNFKVVYKKNEVVPNGALCLMDHIIVNDSFFEMSRKVQNSRLVREVCYGIAGRMLEEYGAKEIEGCGLFGVMIKSNPERMQYRVHPKDEIWQGIFGDTGHSAVYHTLARALIMYATNSNALLVKLPDLYRYIEEKIKDLKWGLLTIE